MDVYKTLKNKISSSSVENIAFLLGYNSLDKGLKILKSFSSYKTLYEWTQNYHYDLVYTSSEFLRCLAKIFEISDDDVNKELNKLKIYQNELNKFKNCEIFINTNFKRTTESIFVLAFCESKRYIKIKANRLAFKKSDEILNIISDIVKQHYIENRGKLGVWGSIKSYIYNNGNKTYTFDVYGNIMKNIVINRSKATLSLYDVKNKNCFFINT